MLSDCEGFPRASIDYAERTKHLALEDERGSRAIADEGALSDEATVRESRVLRSTWNLDAVVRHDRVVAERYFSLHFTKVESGVALELLADLNPGPTYYECFHATEILYVPCWCGEARH